ncbi:MAG: cytochrome C oxidase subunit II [Myxococcaceae bacterium]|nr:cytochrome C oxidase subunit II [Myxococcaceae bacterium]
MSVDLGLPRNVSEHGAAIDALLHRAHLYEAALVALFVGFIVFAVVRFHHRQKARYLPGVSPRAAAGVLAVAVGVFLVVDGTFFVESWRILHEQLWNFDIPDRDPRTTRVEVNAHQWAWDFRQPGPDGVFNTADDVVSWNELRVPVDAPVSMQLSSTDVVHSLYLPNFRQKMDAVPGQLNRLWFRPTEPGDFEIACSQHCGVNHYRMRAVLHVMPRAEYDRWLREAAAIAERAHDPDDAEAQWGWPWR